MPNIVTASQFETGEIYIPNAVSQNAGEGTNGVLAALITKYEKRMLLQLLGTSQYDELQTALGDLPGADLKWRELVDGDGHFWEGVKPILQNYIYCQWLKTDDVKLTSAGKGRRKALNIKPESPVIKYVERWNEMVNCISELKEYLEDTDGLEVWDEFPHFEYENSLGL